MPLKDILIIFSLFLLFSVQKGCLGSVAETELMKKLFHPNNYNVDALPPLSSQNKSSRREVRLGVNLLRLNDINTKDAYMDSFIAIQIVWKDERLSHEEGRWGLNVSSALRLSPSKIWKPPIQLSNLYGKQPKFSGSRALIYPSGEILWILRAEVKSECVIDVTYFPFDLQSCVLKFHDPVHTDEEFTFKFYNEKLYMGMSDFSKSSAWSFVSTNAFSNTLKPSRESEEAYLAFQGTFVRRPCIHLVTLILPIILLCFASPLTFFLPTNSKEKLFINFVSIMSLIALLIHMESLIPVTAIKIPIITKYALFVLLLNITSLTSTTLIFHLGGKESKMGDSIKNFMVLKMGRILKVKHSKELPGDCLMHNDINNKSEKENNLSDLNHDEIPISAAENTILDTLNKRNLKNQESESWKAVALVLDRMFLILFLFVTILGTCIYLIFAKIRSPVDEKDAIQLFKGTGPQ